jgi:hypothetical protein
MEIMIVYIWPFMIKIDENGHLYIFIFGHFNEKNVILAKYNDNYVGP